MAKIHKTMRGVTVNMDTLRIRNEKEVAVGNMNVNAGGDILGPGGKIIKDRNERIRDGNTLHTMVPGKVVVSKNKDDVVRKTAASQASEIEIAAANQIMAEAEQAILDAAGAPKGGLAASVAKKKT